MKISKKTVKTLCIIIPLLAIVLWFTQKPIFFIYHSYAIETENGDIPLTDEQFQQIAQGYLNEKTLRIGTVFDRVWQAGYTIKLYKTKDMSGKYDIMMTGGKGDESDVCLWINDKCFPFDTHYPINIANEIIAEAIEQYESEQE